MKSSLTLFALVSIAVASLALTEGDTTAKKPRVEVPFFGNKDCPLQAKKARADKFVEQNGERVYVCCNMCRGKAKADFDTYRDAAYPAEQIIDVKNDRCPIMGGKTEGSESSTVFQNYRVHFCCDGCDEKFRQDPRRYLTLLTKKDVVALGNKHCLVMAEEKVEADHFFIYDGVLIDSCCDDCPEMFQQEPERYLADAGVDLAKVKAEAAKKREAAKARAETKDGEDDGR